LFNEGFQKSLILFLFFLVWKPQISAWSNTIDLDTQKQKIQFLMTI
jgi:hypothetical protein